MGTNETIDQAECHVADIATIATIHTLLTENGFTTKPGPECPGFRKGEIRNYYRDDKWAFIVDITEYDRHPHLWAPSVWWDVNLVNRLRNGRLGVKMGMAIDASRMTSGEMLAFLHIMYGAQ